MTISTITYEEQVAELDASLDHALDVIHNELAGNCDAETYARLMAKGRRELEKVRSQLIERLDAFWEKVNALPDPTLH